MSCSSSLHINIGLTTRASGCGSRQIFDKEINLSDGAKLTTLSCSLHPPLPHWWAAILWQMDRLKYLESWCLLIVSWSTGFENCSNNERLVLFSGSFLWMACDSIFLKTFLTTWSYYMSIAISSWWLSNRCFGLTEAFGFLELICDSTLILWSGLSILCCCEVICTLEKV